MRLLMLAAMAGLMLTGCATTTPSGDAGCASYGEARLTLPYDAIDDGPLSDWVAVDLDARMTATCR